MSGTISLALCCRLGEKGSIPLLTRFSGLRVSLSDLRWCAPPWPRCWEWRSHGERLLCHHGVTPDPPGSYPEEACRPPYRPCGRPRMSPWLRGATPAIASMRTPLQIALTGQARLPTLVTSGNTISIAPINQPEDTENHMENSLLLEADTHAPRPLATLPQSLEGFDHPDGIATAFRLRDCSSRRILCPSLLALPLVAISLCTQGKDRSIMT